METPPPEGAVLASYYERYKQEKAICFARFRPEHLEEFKTKVKDFRRSFASSTIA